MSQNKNANAIRALAIDAVQKANSGHPGMPMGMADIAEVLWREFLHHNPNNPNWLNRDRFILSNGHGAMLHYALLHLSGYDVSIDDLKSFRQLHSKTPGHPEHGDTPGVETTTGPLGQGVANAVGMALAQKIMASHFNRPGFSLFNHYTYVFLGDGCLMEGISHEACSLAGTLKCNRLIAFWDDNGISIDGEVKHWWTTDVKKRFEAYGWHVIAGVDGHNRDSIRQAIEQAQTIEDKPCLICCKTTIGFGSPNKAGTAGVHGAPLGDDEIVLTKQQLEWTYTPFQIPEDIYAAWDSKAQGSQLENSWNELFKQYEQQFPELAQELKRRVNKALPNDWEQFSHMLIQEAAQHDKPMATRKASGMVIEKLASILPELLGGSADLTGSNCTGWKTAKPVRADDAMGNYIYYGVREFGMAAIMNGLSLYKGLIPFGGTFLVFQTYCANATRMAALMKQRVIYVFTHDSIGLGEDGPTHQPVAETTTLRCTPNMHVWRPCDYLETAVAWQQSIEYKNGPSALLLSRQNCPPQKRTPEQIGDVARGGYILKDSNDTPDIILIATGSEISLAMEAANQLEKNNKSVRVVSMPCCELFDKQSNEYRESVLPKNVTLRIAIEAAHIDYWYKYVGLNGHVIGLNRFGASAPEEQVYEECKITIKHILESVI